MTTTNVHVSIATALSNVSVLGNAYMVTMVTHHVIDWKRHRLFEDFEVGRF